jgi:hypothetical protein
VLQAYRKVYFGRAATLAPGRSSYDRDLTLLPDSAVAGRVDEWLGLTEPLCRVEADEPASAADQGGASKVDSDLADPVIGDRVKIHVCFIPALDHCAPVFMSAGDASKVCADACECSDDVGLLHGSLLFLAARIIVLSASD